MEIATIIIAVIGVYYAARATRAARDAIQLTKGMRWEADLRRIVEAVVAIERAARDMDMDLGHRNPHLDNWTLEQRLRDAQHELERALAFPWFDHPNTEALEIVEKLRTADFQEWEPAEIQRTASKAGTLLTTQPPPPRMPDWYIRAITFRARRRAKGPVQWPTVDGLLGRHRDGGE